MRAARSSQVCYQVVMGRTTRLIYCQVWPDNTDSQHSQTYSVILICRNCHELRLREDEGLEVLRGVVVLPGRVDVDHVEARLISVH